MWILCILKSIKEVLSEYIIQMIIQMKLCIMIGFTFSMFRV